MMTDQQTPLPAAYRGLNAAQAIAQAFFNRTQEWMDQGLPLDQLQTYITRFNMSGELLAKRDVLRDITTKLLANRK